MHITDRADVITAVVCLTLFALAIVLGAAAGL